ncbi:MAG: choice-of-anchor D domain-containing protein [Bacteroidota bacterium]
MSSLRFPLTLVLLLGVLVTPALAQVDVSLPTTTGTVGDANTIDVTVGDLTGQDVIAYEFVVAFDETVLEITGATATDTRSSELNVVTNTNTPGQITVVAAGASPLTGAGTLIKLDVSYLAQGTSALTFTSITLNEGSPAANTTDGSVQVELANTTPTFALSRTSIAFGVVIQTETSTESVDVTNTGTGTITGTITSTGDGFAIVSGGGDYTLAAGASQRVMVSFTPSALGDQTGSLSITHDAGNVASPATVELTGTGVESSEVIEVILPTVRNQPGTTSTLDIGVPDWKGQGFFAMEFTLEYDPSVITVTSVSKTNTATQSFTVIPNLNTPGQVRVAAAGANPNFVPSSNVLLQLEVSNDAEGSSELVLSRIQFNSGTPIAAVTNGNVTVSNPAPILNLAPEGDQDFGEIGVGSAATQTLAVQNAGDAGLSGTVSVSGDGFSLDGGTILTVAQGESSDLAVVFTPTASGQATGTLSIIHNDPFRTSPIEIALTGTGNSAPTVVDDTATTDEDNAVSIDVLSNDADEEDNALTITALSDPADGSATLDGTTVTYTPDGDFNGTDTFTYTVADGFSESTGTVTVTVNAINDAPTEAAITAPTPGASATITGDPDTPFRAEWDASTDADGDDVAYTWQLSVTDDFADPLLSVETGADAFFETTFGVVGPLLTDNGVDLEGSITLFHRVLTTDGTETTTGANAAVTLTRSTLTSTAEETLPTSYTLDQNYPNPFNPVTAIRFGLPEAAHVRLTVHDALGRRVRTLVDETRPAGRHTVTLNAADLPSGTYLYRISAGSYEATRTLTLLK